MQFRGDESDIGGSDCHRTLLVSSIQRHRYHFDAIE
jgi:hypothetical protein